MEEHEARLRCSQGAREGGYQQRAGVASAPSGNIVSLISWGQVKAQTVHGEHGRGVTKILHVLMGRLVMCWQGWGGLPGLAQN